MNEQEASAQPRQMVSFRLGEEEYGVDILCVQEIIRLSRITPVPNAPGFVQGVLNLRGKVIPVIALRQRLGLPPGAESRDTRIVVVDLPPNTIGFTVDAVSEVIRVPLERIDPPPQGGPGGRTEPFIQGIAKLEGRLLLVLDLARLFSTEERDALAA